MKSILSALFVSAVAASSLEQGDRRPHRGHHGCSRVQQECAGAQAQSAYQWCPHNAHTVTVTKTAARTTSTITKTSTISASTTTTTSITVLPTCSQASTKKRNAARKAQPILKRFQDAPSCLGSNPQEACSCLHPTTTTVTVTPSVAHTTTTATITSTATKTSTDTVQGPFTIMGLYGNFDGSVPTASSTPNFAVGTVPASGGGDPYIAYDSVGGDAFYLTSNGTLLDSAFTDTNGNPYVAFQFTDFSTPEGGDAPVTIIDAATVYSSGGYQPLVCFIDPNTCRLDCRANGNENNFQCYQPNNQWYIAPTPQTPNQCYVFSPQIIYGITV